jgi:hypothetical protein
MGWLLEARVQEGVLGQEAEEAEEGEEVGQRVQVAAQHIEKTRAEGTCQSAFTSKSSLICKVMPDVDEA